MPQVPRMGPVCRRFLESHLFFGPRSGTRPDNFPPTRAALAALYSIPQGRSYGRSLTEEWIGTHNPKERGGRPKATHAAYANLTGTSSAVLASCQIGRGSAPS